MTHSMISLFRRVKQEVSATIKQNLVPLEWKAAQVKNRDGRFFGGLYSVTVIPMVKCVMYPAAVIYGAQKALTCEF